jgi:hypothetical protein
MVLPFEGAFPVLEIDVLLRLEFAEHLEMRERA